MLSIELITVQLTPLFIFYYSFFCVLLISIFVSPFFSVFFLSFFLEPPFSPCFEFTLNHCPLLRLFGEHRFLYLLILFTSSVITPFFCFREPVHHSLHPLFTSLLTPFLCSPHNHQSPPVSCLPYVIHAYVSLGSLQYHTNNVNLSRHLFRSCFRSRNIYQMMFAKRRPLRRNAIWSPQSGGRQDSFARW